MVESTIEVIELSIGFLDRIDYISLLNVNKECRKRFSKPETSVFIIRRNYVSNNYIPRFWEFMLKTFKLDVSRPLNKYEYCFEFHHETLDDIVPHYGKNRLMKDEYIDGEISRDIGRTFPNHLIFRHKDMKGQFLLETVLRRISDDYFGVGYCQGMNFVVGTILIGLIDPELNGYYSDNDTDILQQRIQSMDCDEIARQMYDITAALIDRLQMMRLWGYGFPDLPLFTYIFRQYLLQLEPELVDHFDRCGFDLSILVTKWFIPLFSNTIPFFILFRIWDFIFIQGIPGLFRIAASLVIYFKKELMNCDLIQISEFLNFIGRKHLMKEKEVQLWFDIVLQLHQINRETYSSYVNEFQQRCTITMTMECISKRDQLSADIAILLKRIRDIHDEESLLRNDLRNNITDEKRYTEEWNSLRTQKKNVSDVFDYLLSNQSDLEGKSYGEMSPQEKDQSEILSQLSIIDEKMKEVEEGLTSVKLRVEEGIQNLEDIYTKRLSLRIQLSQLMKEKSLLSFSTVIH